MAGLSQSRIYLISGDLIPAAIQQRGDFDKLRLSKLDCFLRLTEDRLELLDHNGERVLHWFPYLLIRRYVIKTFNIYLNYAVLPSMVDKLHHVC